MPPQYITQTNPYEIPSGLTRTQTVDGGTAWIDQQGNVYIQDAGGFKYSPNVQVVSSFGNKDVSTATSPTTFPASDTTTTTTTGSVTPPPQGLELTGGTSTSIGNQQNFTYKGKSHSVFVPQGKDPMGYILQYIKDNNLGSFTSPYSDFPQITRNLQSQMSGEDVKALQEWLIKQGYKISSATGYYGSQTQAAVAQWQSDNGIDTKGNPGYFGPISMSFVSNQQKNAPTPIDAGDGTSLGKNVTDGTTQQYDSSIGYDSSLSKYGITEDVWNGLDPSQQAILGIVITNAKSQYGANVSNVTLESALASAANDPNIIAKYADVFALDKNALNQSLQSLQSSVNVDAQNRQIQFENERKQLASQSAQAGQTYSGFRSQAEQQLGTIEQGIIQSSRQQLQDTLNQKARDFEAKYGSSVANPLPISITDPYSFGNISLGGTFAPSADTGSTISGANVGGITGTEPIAKQIDIRNLAIQDVGLGQTPPIY